MTKQFINKTDKNNDKKTNTQDHSFFGGPSRTKEEEAKYFLTRTKVIKTVKKTVFKPKSSQSVSIAPKASAQTVELQSRPSGSLASKKKILLEKKFYLTKTKDESFSLTKEEINQIAEQEGSETTLDMLIENASTLGRLKRDTLLTICQRSNAYKVFRCFFDSYSALKLICPPKIHIDLFKHPKIISIVNALTSEETQPSLEKYQALILMLSEEKQPSLEKRQAAKHKLEAFFNTIKEVATSANLAERDALLILFINHYEFFLRKFNQEQLIEIFEITDVLTTITALTSNTAIMEEIEAKDLLHIIKQRRQKSAEATLQVLNDRFTSLNTKFGYSTLIGIAKKEDSSETLVQIDLNYEQLCHFFPDLKDRQKLRPSSGKVVTLLVTYYNELTSPNHLNLNKKQLIEFINARGAAASIELLFKDNLSFNMKNYQVLQSKGYSSETMAILIRAGSQPISFLLEHDLTSLKDKEGEHFTLDQLAKIALHGKIKTLQAIHDKFKLMMDLDLTIKDIFFLANQETGHAAIEAFISQCKPLQAIGYSPKQSMKIAKTTKPLETTKAILANHDKFMRLGYLHDDIAAVIFRGNGPERIASLLTKSTELFAMGFGVKTTVSAIRYAGRGGIKTFIEKRAKLVGFGFDDDQINAISAYDGSSKTINFLVEKFRFLHDTMGFSIDQMAKMAAQHGASFTLAALIENYSTSKKNKDNPDIEDLKLTNAERVEIASNPYAAPTVKNFFRLYNGLRKKGVERSEILLTAFHRSGGSALETLDENHDEFVMLKDKNNTDATTEQLVSISHHVGAKKTINYFIKHYSKLNNLMDNKGNFLDNQKLTQIASRANAVESLEILVDMHHILIQLKDHAGNALNNDHIYAILRHSMAAKTMKLIIKPSLALKDFTTDEFGQSFSKITNIYTRKNDYKKVSFNAIEMKQLRDSLNQQAKQLNAKIVLDNYTLFTDLEANGGMELTNDELVTITSHNDAWHDLESFIAHYKALRKKGYEKSQLLSLSRHDLGFKIINFVANNHAILIEIKDQHGVKLTSSDIFTLSSHDQSFKTLQYIIDHNKKLMGPAGYGGRGCTIEDLLSIGQNIESFDIEYDNLIAKGYKHKEIVAISATIRGGATLKTALNHHDTYIKPKADGGFGFTHNEFVSLVSRNYGDFYLNNITLYLNNPQNTDIPSPAEIVSMIDREEHLKKKNKNNATSLPTANVSDEYVDNYDDGFGYDNDTANSTTFIESAPELHRGFFSSICSIHDQIEAMLSVKNSAKRDEIGEDDEDYPYQEEAETDSEDEDEAFSEDNVILTKRPRDKDGASVSKQKKSKFDPKLFGGADAEKSSDDVPNASSAMQRC